MNCKVRLIHYEMRGSILKNALAKSHATSGKYGVVIPILNSVSQKKVK